MPYCFSCFMARLFTDQSVYFYISNCSWNYNPQVEFANEASQFQCKFWEKHDITMQPVITYIYLCVWWYAASLWYFFKPSNWNVKQAWKNLYTIGILSYTDSWCLVSFSSNISCDRTYKLDLCFDYRIRNSVIYQSLNDVVLCSRVHSKKILLQNMPSPDVPCAAILGRVNEALFPVMLICCYYKLHCTARCTLWREWKAYCCIAKQET